MPNVIQTTRKLHNTTSHGLRVTIFTVATILVWILILAIAFFDIRCTENQVNRSSTWRHDIQMEYNETKLVLKIFMCRGVVLIAPPAPPTKHFWIILRELLSLAFCFHKIESKACAHKSQQQHHNKTDHFVHSKRFARCFFFSFLYRQNPVNPALCPSSLNFNYQNLQIK